MRSSRPPAALFWLSAAGWVLLLLITVGHAGPLPATPDKLPFAFERADKGTAPSEQEIAALSARLTRFWKASEFFDWILRTSHGVDASTGMPDYLCWWHDIEAEKQGDLVTFRHTKQGGGHNIMIPTTRVLSQVAAGFLLTGDKAMGKIAEQYAKCVTASMKGMVWDENDPLPYLMARNIVVRNHEYLIEGGRKKRVDYSLWRTEAQDWNAHRIHFPHNPTWGDIYVTNMRSKDDVPHIYRAAAFLPYLAQQAPDPQVRAAAAEAYDYLRGFAKDIVDHDFHIRTKDKEGKPYIPKQDLASFVDYGPQAECTARLVSALLGTGDPQGIDCQSGDGGLYEDIAVRNHYYNYEIIRGFHMAAVLHALLHGQLAAAKKLLEGLAARADELMSGKGHKQGRKSDRWNPDVAIFLLQSASVGLPLTGEEVRLIHREYARALDSFEAFSRWDLWDPSVPDGVYGPDGGYAPGHRGIIREEEIASALEYCFSPFKNPEGEKIFDCDSLADTGRW